MKQKRSGRSSSARGGPSRSSASSRPAGKTSRTGPGRTFGPSSGRASGLPEVVMAEVSHVDPDGDVVALPVDWKESDGKPPRLFITPASGQTALGVGDRALLRVRRMGPRSYTASVLRRLDAHKTARFVGLYQETAQGARVVSSDRRQKQEVVVSAPEKNGARNGELVVVELKAGASLGLPQGRVVERLGFPNAPNAISLIAIRTHDIPATFSPAAVREAEKAAPPTLGTRTDLRAFPLVTIDGSDARDFDDAVYAERDGAGWKLLVAIADVAHYVHPDSALDHDAYERGNSTYFPDRVVPMLPEALSNGLCSLRPEEDRACLACWLWIDSAGELTRYSFLRGLMRSQARLTYEQVQDAADGKPDALTAPLMESVVTPLYGAYKALLAARVARDTLELDLPERKIVLDEKGRVVDIAPRSRLDSHRLIEEFMIAANVAAAKALEAKHAPCLFRVHEPPSDAKAESLRVFLKPLGYSLPQAKTLHPRLFARILEQAQTSPLASLISMVVLRSQSQARYSPDNLGHFGLALSHYAHFTSPIRRYADLIVHRSLITAYGLGDGGITTDEVENLEEIAEHISSTERRSAYAERDAGDRYAALYLGDRVGETFAGAVSGITRFGLFVSLDSTGVDGLIPLTSLRDDRYEHDEAHHTLTGRRWGRTFRLGARCRVRLVSADPLLGSITFDLLEIDDQGEDAPSPTPSPSVAPAPSPKGPSPKGPRRKKRSQ